MTAGGAAAEAVVHVRVDDSNVDADVSKAGKKAGGGFVAGFGSSMKGLAGIVGVAVAGAAVGGFISDAFDEAREGQKVAATTEQIIKSTGAAAKVTASQVGDLAGAISAKTGMDDEAIQSGANLLLTFKNVRNEVGANNDIFNQATAAAADLSAAGFGDLNGAAKQLGKALNDPIKGITALSRSGVTFTEQQKAQIEAMVAAGDTLGAQKIILGEVQAQVGGVAEASATFGEKASVAFGNIKEQVGTALLPALDSVLGFFVNTGAPAITAAIDGIGPAFTSVAGVVGPVFSALAGQAGTLNPLFQTMAATFTGTILPAVQSFGSFAAATLVPIFQQVGGVLVSSVIPALVSLGQFIYGTVYPAVVQIATTVGSNLQPVFVALAGFVTGTVLPAIGRIAEVFRNDILPAITPVISVVLQVTGFLVGLATKVLGVVLPPLLRLAGFLVDVLVGAFGLVGTAIGKVGDFLGVLGGIITGAAAKFIQFHKDGPELVQRGLSSLLDVVRDLPGKITALGGLFLDAGRAIIGKFVDGLKGAGGLVSDIAGNVWDAVRGLLNNAIGRINSALEFTIKIPGAPDFTINPPDIPMLATGGIITRPGLYVGAERGPEAVIPLTSGGGPVFRELAGAIAEALGPSMGHTISLSLPTGDPQAAGMAVLNALARQGRR